MNREEKVKPDDHGKDNPAVASSGEGVKGVHTMSPADELAHAIQQLICRFACQDRRDAAKRGWVKRRAKARAETAR